MGEFDETDDKPKNNFVRSLETVEKLVVLGLVIFIVYEMFKFNGSQVGKALAKLFGNVAGFSTWLAAHPNTLISLIFLGLLTPLAGIIARGTFKSFQRRAKLAKAMREAETKITVEVKQNNPNMSEQAVEKSVELGAQNKFAKDAQQEIQDEKMSGQSVSGAQQEAADAANKISEEDYNAADPDEKQAADEAENDFPDAE